MKKKLLIITLILIAFQGFSQEEPFSFHSLKGSNWGAFDIKTDNPLYNLIGKEVFGKESFDFTSSLGIPETESFQDIRHLQYFASGVEIVYKANDEKIASIFLLAPNYSSWYEAFTGKLPYGLNWNMTKSEVENRIGNGEEYHRMSDVYAQMTPEQKMKVQPIPTKKQIAFEFNGEDFQMNFDDFKLDEIVKIGLNTADLGLKISEGFGNINIDTEYFNSPEWKAQIEKIEKNAADMDAYYNSPEWKKNIEEIEKNAKRVAEYYNSPEWKKYIEGIEANAKRIEDYYNSPEWKAQVEKIEKSAAELEEYFNSPEWKNKEEEIKKTVEKFNNPQAINLRNEAFEFRNKALEWRDEAFQFRNKAMEIRNKATKIRSEASKLPFDSKERRLLMGQYDEEMRKYNAEMEKYNREMGKYNAEMARYNEKMNLYQASLNS